MEATHIIRPAGAYGMQVFSSECSDGKYLMNISGQVKGRSVTGFSGPIFNSDYTTEDKIVEKWNAMHSKAVFEPERSK